MKDKTAMQKLIERLKEIDFEYKCHIKNAKLQGEVFEDLVVYNKGICNSILLAESLLADEKKQIVVAYYMGKVDESLIAEEIEPNWQNGEHYYSGKFED